MNGTSPRIMNPFGHRVSVCRLAAVTGFTMGRSYAVAGQVLPILLSMPSRTVTVCRRTAETWRRWRCGIRYLEVAHHMYCGVGRRLIVEMPRVVPALKLQLQVVQADRKQRH